jgi:hypothetical protein
MLTKSPRGANKIAAKSLFMSRRQMHDLTLGEVARTNYRKLHVENAL